jgi:hypothetical protein
VIPTVTLVWSFVFLVSQAIILLELAAIPALKIVRLVALQISVLHALKVIIFQNNFAIPVSPIAVPVTLSRNALSVWMSTILLSMVPANPAILLLPILQIMIKVKIAAMLILPIIVISLSIILLRMLQRTILIV